MCDNTKSLPTSEASGELKANTEVGGGNPQVEVKYIDPLKGITFKLKNSFNEWVKIWENALLSKDPYTLLGLLFELDNNCFCWREQTGERGYEYKGCTDKVIKLLFQIADGNQDKWYKSFNGQNVVLNADYRFWIAQKALSVLCNKFFEFDDKSIPSWWIALYDQSLFDTVIWFFRSREDYPGQLVNVSSLETETKLGSKSRFEHDTIIKFLDQFCRLGWKCDEYRGRLNYYNLDLGYDKEIALRLEAAKQQFIRILHFLKKLNFLLEVDPDVATISALEKLVLGEELYLPKLNKPFDNTHRIPTTIEEATFGGSYAAVILKALKIKLSETRRLESKQKMIRKKEDQAESLRQLELAKKAAREATKNLKEIKRGVK